jgi:hypothetical protein
MKTRIKLGTLTASLLAAACLGHAAAAHADFGITSFDGNVVQQNGDPATQAGSHPYSATTDIEFNTTLDSNNQTIPDGTFKDVQVDLPPGLVGDPSATPKCPMATFMSLSSGACPDESAVGVSVLHTSIFGDLFAAVYNLETPPGVPARFGFRVLTATVLLDASVRTGSDYGLTINIRNSSQGLPVTGTVLTFWGVPADSSHDGERGQCEQLFGGPSGSLCPSQAPHRAFLTNPTLCNGPLTTTVRASSWQNPSTFDSASFVSHDNSDQPIGPDGCDKLSFNPTVDVQAVPNVFDSPSAVTVDLRIPQNDDPNGLASAQLKRAVVTLPAGVSLNPAAADGLAACSPAQIALNDASDPTCPDASRIGTVQVNTPLLPDPMTGTIYLAKQNDNPFSSPLAMYVVAQGHGVTLKLPGKVGTDPNTGQLTATFDNNPQLPFSELKLSFDGGPRAPLAMPDSCGTKTVTSTLDSYAGDSASPTGSFDVTGCPGALPFAPSFAAGSTNPSAGAGTGFTLQVGRADGQQHLRSLSVSLPPGLLANVGSVPLCGDAQAAAGTCSDASQVGTSTVAAGAGAHPFYLSGKAFLTGAYKGAPFGLSIVVPAVAGPLNLGTVVVRAAIAVDPHDAHLTITSDDLPQILQGIPLRLRSIEVDVNRPGFMFNPTNCSPMAVTGAINSVEGASVPGSSRFQVGDCGTLAFKPTIGTTLTGGRANTRSGQHPGLNVVVKSPKGQANLRSVALTLPRTLTLNLSTAAACTRAQLDSNSCPAASRYGTARAVTPALPAPLTGPVYLVTPPGGGLPGLVVQLSGSGVHIELDAQSAIIHKRLRNTFTSIPDVPISEFDLSLSSGNGALLTPNSGLCSAAQHSSLNMTSQNGRRVTRSVTLSTPCAKSRKTRRTAHRGRRGAVAVARFG